MSNVIHLYWAYDHPKWVKDFPRLTIGYSVCGERLTRNLLTKWKDDNECEACKERLMQQQPKRKIARRRFVVERRQLKLP